MGFYLKDSTLKTYLPDAEHQYIGKYQIQKEPPPPKKKRGIPILGLRIEGGKKAHGDCLYARYT